MLLAYVRIALPIEQNPDVQKIGYAFIILSLVLAACSL
jgi:hypothetical protein